VPSSAATCSPAAPTGGATPDTISSQELIRYFTLAPTGVEFVEHRRGVANQLGVAVQLCTLPWLGYVPTDLTEVPAPALARLSDRLRLPLGELRAYGTREQTRSDHLREVARHLRWRAMQEAEAKELETYLLARAMEHDSPTALFRAACAHLRSACVIRPGPVWLLERVVAAREAAKAETYQRIEPLLTEVVRLDLDHLLRVDPALGPTRLHWLSDGATQASPNAVNAEVAKLEYLRSLDAHALDVPVLPTERRRHLATIGRRSTAQGLARREPQVRYPILLTLLSQGAVEVLDEVVQLFDQVVSATEGRARVKMTGREGRARRTGGGVVARAHRHGAAAGRARHQAGAAAARPRPPRRPQGVLHLPARMRSGGTGRGALCGQRAGPRPPARVGGAARAQRHRRAQGARGRAGLLRARPLARLPGHRRSGQGQRGL
jgi:hypothetical protein